MLPCGTLCTPALPHETECQHREHTIAEAMRFPCSFAMQSCTFAKRSPCSGRMVETYLSLLFYFRLAFALSMLSHVTWCNTTGCNTQPLGFRLAFALHLRTNKPLTPFIRLAHAKPSHCVRPAVFPHLSALQCSSRHPRANAWRMLRGLRCAGYALVIRLCFAVAVSSDKLTAC
jgi:hypothetical protein